MVVSSSERDFELSWYPVGNRHTHVLTFTRVTAFSLGLWLVIWPQNGAVCPRPCLAVRTYSTHSWGREGEIYIIQKVKNKKANKKDNSIHVHVPCTCKTTNKATQYNTTQRHVRHLFFQSIYVQYMYIHCIHAVSVYLTNDCSRRVLLSLLWELLPFLYSAL